MWQNEVESSTIIDYWVQIYSCISNIANIQNCIIMKEVVKHIKLVVQIGFN
jgi:hypothetical protein